MISFDYSLHFYGKYQKGNFYVKEKKTNEPQRLTNSEKPSNKCAQKVRINTQHAYIMCMRKFAHAC